MDANGTHYQLLLNFQDWALCQEERPDGSLPILRESWLGSPPGASDLAWDWERHELTLQPSIHLYLPKGKKPPLLKIESRRGAARDRYGNWYWIDESSDKIRILSSGSGRVSNFWPVTTSAETSARRTFQPQGFPQPEASLGFSGLTVTEHHFLVVGVQKPSGLLVFDLHAGGPPRQLLWPEGIDFSPFDMAPMPGGGVWILDREHRCYWALDRNFTAVDDNPDASPPASGPADPFQPLNAAPGAEPCRLPAKHFPSGITLGAASPLEVTDPVAIEALPDCTVLILDQNIGPDQDGNPKSSRVFRYRSGEPLGEPVGTDALKEMVEAEGGQAFYLNAHDFAFLPEHAAADGSSIPDRLYFVSQDGNQTFAFKIDDSAGQLVLQPVAEYLPMRMFSGKGIVAGGGQVYYDSGERWLPLVAQERPRYHPEAVLQTDSENPFDGRQPGTVWHRLMLDACLPPGTRVQIWSRAADSPDDLQNLPWQLQPSPYRRGDGTELPFVPIPARPASQEGGLPLRISPAELAAQGCGTWELLFQSTRGRYLQLRIQLDGDGVHTPRLRALRAYYPRFSYAEHYLPTVYRRDDASASFLERCLANMEGFYTTLEDRLTALPALLDVRSAPVETLDWLANWFGVALDSSWDETRRRLFIRNAMSFFQYRGTLPGLLMALQLTLVDPVCEAIFTNPIGTADRPGSIRIVEKYHTRRVPPIVYGDPTGTTPLDEAGLSWQPGDGAQALHNLYAQALQDLNLPAVHRYPIQAPDAAYLAAWRSFSRRVLGFIPSAGPKDLSLWQEFLAKKYATLAAFQKVYGVSSATESFAKFQLLADLPDDKSQLLDWYSFEANVLNLRNSAHRFTVLLPLQTGVEADSPEYARRLGLAQRILELEKPAHTSYEIRFYWAMFRLGEARLGDDTVIDQGGRDPRLNPPLILGQGHLSESHLTPRHPQDQADRLVSDSSYGL